MDKIKRSYYLPGKLLSAFDKECRKSGYVREAVVAAALYGFMESDPKGRAEMFERLSKFMGSKGS